MTGRAMGRIPGIMIVMGCLLAGCSMRKQSTHERTAVQVSDQLTASREWQSRQHEQTATEHIRLEYANSVAEIIPVGAFRLSADSGYIGQAKRVLISQERGGLQQTGSSRVVSTSANSATMVAAREYTASERDTAIGHQEVGASPPLKIPWWVWLCGAGVVFYLIRRLVVR